MVIQEGEAHQVSLQRAPAEDWERFAFVDGAVVVEKSPSLCLGAQDKSLKEGARVVLQSCERPEVGKPAPHQAFSLQGGRIKAATAHLCMNVKGGKMVLGTEIILWPCEDPESRKNEMFLHRNGMIQVQHHADLHFNIEGGAPKMTEPGAPIVLWRSMNHIEDSFEFLTTGQLRMRAKNSICLNAERGLKVGHTIIGWPCSSEGAPAANELFGYDQERKVIFAKQDPGLVFNVKKAHMEVGGQIVLWPSIEVQDEL